MHVCMDPPRPRSARRAVLASLLAVLAVAVAPGLALADGPTASSLSPTTATPLPPSPFGAIAGYSSSLADAVPRASSLAGTVEVVLSFRPSSTAFYLAPAAGDPALTLGQIADRYGLSPSMYAAVEAYFEARGLAVVHAWPDRLSLSLAGPAARVGAAFGTSLRTGDYEGRTVSFPASAPSLPSWLESEIDAVSGLAGGWTPFTLPALGAASPVADAAPEQNPADLVTPSIARDIYDISGLYNLTSAPTYATGKGVVLLLWGKGYVPSDIATFFSSFYPASFPAPVVTPYPVDGAPPPSSGAANDPSNGSRELTLDLEWSGSMAPGADLDAVYAPDGPAGDNYSPSDASMIDALNTAVDPSDVPNVAVISMSFGSADGADPSFQTAYEQDFQEARDEGITVFAATGDTGGDAGAGCAGGPQAQYPAASPQVIAVGGTAVTLQRSVLGSVNGFSETAWSQSGGGFSSVYAAPSWQEVGSAAAPIEANGHRGTPDVAATAGYNMFYFDGVQEVGGGTSFATPLWAGMVAEMDALRGANPSFGFVTPDLYELAATESGSQLAFHDVTTGSNCLGPAGPGWDTATGWGSPDAVLLYEHLVASFVNITLSATPGLVGPGGSVSISVTVSNATSGRPIVGVPVRISLTSGAQIGPCSGTFGTVTPYTNASGEAATSVAVSSCYLGSAAVASGTVASGGYYGSASATVEVNLFGLSPALAPFASFPLNLVFFVVLMAVATVVGGLLGRRPPELVPASPAGAPAPPPSAPGDPPAVAGPNPSPTGSLPPVPPI